MIRSNKGAALPFVIVTLLVVFVMVGIVAFLAQTNIAQAGAQERGLQAYYAARSGAEIAFEALWATDTGAESGTTLLKALKDGSKPSEETIDLGEAGKATVSIDYKKSGKDEIITINSQGEYNGMRKKVKLEVFFEVDASDTNKSILKDMIWSK
ncbi:MAG: hypothetical protein ACOX4U_03860 [Anaerovoracaceae bacterium]|jgi:hypothetical protein